MRSLDISGAAKADLIAIINFGRQTWGEKRAQDYKRQFFERFQDLRKTPDMGPLRDDIAPYLRSFTVGSHVIFYRVNEVSVGILRILHQSMDIHRHLSD
ncbi:type II toxin-antitoxin system RelE/ParE family toxin [Lacibacterium aquatile]|uniref:Toxin n=1 Tax=Lacibacterium aquatile TaxID=1168082 RepID=A0ABW5DVE8_9PROT